MHWITLSLLLASAALAEQKPPCNKSNHGQFWPEAANSSADARRIAIRDGSLQMCSYGVWKYRWEAMTVNVRRMGKNRKAPVSDLAATAAESKR